MNIATYIDALVSYATKRGLTQPEDYDVARNKLLDLLQLDSCPPSEAPQPEALEEILKGLLDYACGQGLCQDHAAARDLFDSRLMGALTPFPREILAVSGLGMPKTRPPLPVGITRCARIPTTFAGIGSPSNCTGPPGVLMGLWI